MAPIPQDASDDYRDLFNSIESYLRDPASVPSSNSDDGASLADKPEYAVEFWKNMSYYEQHYDELLQNNDEEFMAELQKRGCGLLQRLGLPCSDELVRLVVLFAYVHYLDGETDVDSRRNEPIQTALAIETIHLRAPDVLSAGLTHEGELYVQLQDSNFEVTVWFPRTIDADNLLLSLEIMRDDMPIHSRFTPTRRRLPPMEFSFEAWSAVTNHQERALILREYANGSGQSVVCTFDYRSLTKLCNTLHTVLYNEAPKPPPNKN